MDPESLLLAGAGVVLAILGSRRQQTAAGPTSGQQVAGRAVRAAVLSGAVVRSAGRVATGLVTIVPARTVGAAAGVLQRVGDTTSDFAGVAVVAAGEESARIAGLLFDGAGVVLSLATSPLRRG